MAEITKTIVPAGLYTDPGPFSAAPEGALVEAQNVVIQRDGLLEPRPSLIMTSVTGASQPIINHGHYIEDVGNFIWYTNGASWEIIRAETDVITGPSDFTFGQINSEYVKGRLLFTSNEGVCEMPQESGDTIAYRAGLPRISIPPATTAYGSATTNWLPIGSSVAYRFVLARRRADGILMLSPPTGRLLVRNSSGTDMYPILFNTTNYSYNPYDVDSVFDALVPGDEIYIYRSPKVASLVDDPSDEMKLRGILTISSGAVDQFADKLDDDEWSGPPLYTNSTQDGILQANERPGYARDIALYNGMTLYGGAVFPHRIVLTIKNMGQEFPDPSQALCSKNDYLAPVVGATSLGVAKITGLSSTELEYIFVGQVVQTANNTIKPGDASTHFPAGTYVTAKGATSVTTSAAALVTDVTADLYFFDWIEVTDNDSGESLKLYASIWNGGYWDNAFQTQDYNFGTEIYLGGYQDLDRAYNNSPDRPTDIICHTSGSSQFVGCTVIFERASLLATDFTVKSTKPLAFDRYVDTVTGVASSQDGNGARLAISKTDIPDAVPLLNYIDIGDLSSDIIRVIPAQNTCLVFKEDGIYQVFGNDPSSLSVEQLDAMVRPVPSQYAGQWFTKQGSTIFMGSTLGPMAVTDSGATPIGGPIMETLIELFGQGFSQTESQNYYISCGSSPDMPYILFSYCNISTEEWNTFVFNANNGTWTTWTARRAFVAYWPGQHNRLYVGIGYGLTDALYGYFDSLRQNMRLAQYSSNETFFSCDIVADNLFSSSPSSLGDGWYQLSEAEDVVIPEVGDSIKRWVGSDWGIIEELVDADTFNVSIYDGSISTSSASFYIREGFAIRVMFAPVTLGQIGTEKLFQKLSFAFNEQSLLLRLNAEFESYRLDENKEQISESIQIAEGWTRGLSTSEKDKTLAWSPDFISIDIPRSVANDWALKVGFSIQQAHAWFSLGAIALKADVAGDLINRGRS